MCIRDRPWGLRIYQWDQAAGHALRDASGEPIVKGVFHPTFLYEALWCLALAGVLVWWDRRSRPALGQVFAGVIGGYSLGRFFIELMRTDDANRILGLRVNTWMSAFIILVSVVTVSYTHLDVYKRQVPESIAAMEALIELSLIHI